MNISAHHYDIISMKHILNTLVFIEITIFHINLPSLQIKNLNRTCL